ncbi:MAG: SDR family NAD(P)-dependent oxidoreductase [Actinomycetales bacterium]|nr:SDR family NAD(P)-dependent oxidoreductase [Actinomycetales bacterium]
MTANLEALEVTTPAWKVIPDRFAGHTAVVTGAGSGIGLATTRRMLDEGATVIAVDMHEDRIAAVMQEYSDGSCVPVVGDLVESVTIDRIMQAAHGEVDLLANVAGIMDGFLPPGEVDDGTWDRVLAVNLTAPMRLVRAALPSMLAKRSGAIVNVSSESGFRASVAGAAYTASKHGLNGYTKSIATFYQGQGIRANVVAPGAVRTNIDAPFKSQFAAGVLGPWLKVGVFKQASADEAASAITYLLSAEASNINGAILPCDAGWSAC